MNPKSVTRLLSLITIFMALILFIPTLVSVYYGEGEAVKAFLITIVIMLAVSLAGLFFSRNIRNRTFFLTQHQEFQDKRQGQLSFRNAYMGDPDILRCNSALSYRCAG